MAHEPQDMMDAVSRSMRERTGRTLQEWVDLVRAEGLDPLDQKSVRAWLKAAHALPQNTQWAVADAAARAAGWQRPSVEGYADAMYTGRKAPLRPLHEAVVAAALGLGGVQAQGRATYIPLVRHSQFAAVGPGTYGRLRIGFRFRGNVPADARLEPAKRASPRPPTSSTFPQWTTTAPPPTPRRWPTR